MTLTNVKVCSFFRSELINWHIMSLSLIAENRKTGTKTIYFIEFCFDGWKHHDYNLNAPNTQYSKMSDLFFGFLKYNLFF